MDIQPIPRFEDIAWRKLAYVTSMIIVFAIGASFFVTVEIKQDVFGEIIADGEIKIQGVVGTVTEVYAKAPQQVEKGEPLFKVERDFSLTTSGATRQAFDNQTRDGRLSTIEAQYTVQETELRAQLASQQALLQSKIQELSLSQNQIAETRRLVEDAERTYQRLNSAKQYVLTDRLEQAASDLSQKRIALQQSMANQRQLTGQQAMAQAAKSQLEASLQKLELQKDKEFDLVRNQYEQDHSRFYTIVSAPIKGNLVFSNVYQGGQVRPEDVTMVVTSAASSEPLKVALSIPSRRRGFVQVGQTVRLKFDAFPYAKFGTYQVEINSISSTTVMAGGARGASPEDAKQQAAAGAGSDFVAWAILPSKVFKAGSQEHTILPGMRVVGAVVVEKRSIAEWVFAPLFEMARG